MKVESGSWKGVLLAVIATLIWSGNFIIARSVHDSIPPVSLAFYRWLCATFILVPLVWKDRAAIGRAVREKPGYYLAIGITGVSLFNTLVYVAGKYSPAINLALVGTTSSPLMVILLGRIVFKERISWLRATGLVLCMSGILFLMAKGSWENLLALRFGKGDLWILGGALAFAIYTLLVRKKKDSLRPDSFLFLAFLIGTICLIPFYIWELKTAAPVQWNFGLAGIILYLGLGASVIAFLCWNGAISRIGAVRTSLFGNLIPLFSSIEALWLLNEQLGWVHLISGLLILSGLVLANRIQKL